MNSKKFHFFKIIIKISLLVYERLNKWEIQGFLDYGLKLLFEITIKWMNQLHAYYQG